MEPDSNSPRKTKRIPFKVDIAGVIEIMGTSLYSHPNTPVRELLQNAHDAIMRRRARDLSYQGRIDVLQDAATRTITFIDDGIGLSQKEAEDYLGTLGIGITGLIKKGATDAFDVSMHSNKRDGSNLIGQFGIGLFSAFMLADKLVVESLRFEGEEAVRWEAGAGTDIELSTSDRTTVGTSVTLYLKANYAVFADDAELLESGIKQYADFLPIPIHLNHSSARSNLIQASWLEPTPDSDAVEEQIASYFGETPLDVILIAVEAPVAIKGALYVSPQRTPGFADDATIAVSVRRMVISRHIREIVPVWAPFLRGVLELPNCSPTSNREDLVRDAIFDSVCDAISDEIYVHFDALTRNHPHRWQSILHWHRYTFAGMAIHDEKLRVLLQSTYKFITSHGELTVEQILNRSRADALVEDEADYVVWYNADRRQEAWLNEFFANGSTPCVHTLRSFEETLLASMLGEMTLEQVDLRAASPSSTNFCESILGMEERVEASAEWHGFFDSLDSNIFVASTENRQPVMAFVNERYELSKTFDELRENGELPRGFQRLIDQHFQRSPAGKNEIVLNTQHRLVRRALEQGASSPLANVLRILVIAALSKAGARIQMAAQEMQAEDLEAIADAL
ncbi:MAG: ATP-binding protein [Planctomycetota bacterium]|nr:ATP-binding protein [Planctomycetota bacterium]